MKPRFTITNAITGALTKIERARGFLEAAKLSEEWIAEMQHRALVLEAHHTTHIEGTRRLTLEQSERLLAGKEVPEADPEDARELLNYREAFDLVAGYLGSGQPITDLSLVGEFGLYYRFREKETEKRRDSFSGDCLLCGWGCK